MMRNTGTGWYRNAVKRCGNEILFHCLNENRSELTCGGNEAFVKTFFVTTLGSTTTLVKSVLYVLSNSAVVIGFTNFHVAFVSVKE